MDSFDFDNVKAEKANAMRRYRRLRRFEKFVLVLEVCVALIALSWLSPRLPAAVKLSGQYLRELSIVLVSTPSVFIIGNIIIIALVAQSCKFPGQNSNENNSTGNDLYDEYVRNSESRHKIAADNDPLPPPQPEETSHHDKQIVCLTNALPPMHEHTVATVSEKAVDTVPTVTKKPLEPKRYQRTQSESFERVKPPKELRRSVTEKCRKSKSRGNEPARLSDAVEDLSNEEFRRKVEAFIEMQQRSLKEESMAVVLSNRN